MYRLGLALGLKTLFLQWLINKARFYDLIPQDDSILPELLRLTDNWGNPAKVI